MRLIVALFFLVSFVVKAQSTITFAVGHDHHKMVKDYPFYAASWQMINEELTRLGYHVETHVYPWARAKDSVKKGKSDGLFLAANFKGREEWAELTSAIGKDQFGVFQNHRSDPLTPIGSVRTISTYSQLSFLEPNNLVKVATAQEGLILLSNQKLRGFVMSRSYGEYLLANELKSLKQRLEFNEEKVETYTAHIAVSKSNQNKNKLVSIFNKAIQNAIQSGRYINVMKEFKVKDYQLVIFK